jgi:hypothetical protein
MLASSNRVESGCCVRRSASPRDISLNKAARGGQKSKRLLAFGLDHFDWFVHRLRALVLIITIPFVGCGIGAIIHPKSVIGENAIITPSLNIKHVFVPDLSVNVESRLIASQSIPLVWRQRPEVNFAGATKRWVFKSSGRGSENGSRYIGVEGIGLQSAVQWGGFFNGETTPVRYVSRWGDTGIFDSDLNLWNSRDLIHSNVNVRDEHVRSKGDSFLLGLNIKNSPSNYGINSYKSEGENRYPIFELGKIGFFWFASAALFWRGLFTGPRNVVRFIMTFCGWVCFSFGCWLLLLLQISDNAPASHGPSLSAPTYGCAENVRVEAIVILELEFGNASSLG